jgi:hypothetical protein
MVFGNFLHFLFVQNLDLFCWRFEYILSSSYADGRLVSAEIISNLEYLFLQFLFFLNWEIFQQNV